MVTVTDQAAEILRVSLAKARTEPGQTFRLVLTPGGRLGLGLDHKREGDQVVTANGEKVLLIAPDVAEALDEATIAIQDTEGGRKVVICRPTGVSQGAVWQRRAA